MSHAQHHVNDPKALNQLIGIQTSPYKHPCEAEGVPSSKWQCLNGAPKSNRNGGGRWACKNVVQDEPVRRNNAMKKSI